MLRTYQQRSLKSGKGVLIRSAFLTTPPPNFPDSESFHPA
jgi:hypothetical protein